MLIQPSAANASNETYADNSVANMVIRGASEGIGIRSANCPTLPEKRCKTSNTWTNTTIVGNSVRVRRIKGVDGPRGIRPFMANIGDVFKHAKITDNTVEVLSPNADTGISVSTGGDSRESRISDVLIARNTIIGEIIGIDVNARANRAQATTTRNVRVIDNKLHLDGLGQASWFRPEAILHHIRSVLRSAIRMTMKSAMC